MCQSPFSYKYVAYIDEAGDPNLRSIRPIDPNGSSEWLVLGAVIIRAENEENSFNWLNDIRKDLGVDRNGALHFRNLSESRRERVCELISGLPLRGFAVCSNKKNMRQYKNERAAKIDSQEWFYNWMIRLILERVTSYCEEQRIKDRIDACKIKIVFSRRGGHRYSQTKAYALYLSNQEKANSLFLTKRSIKTDLLDVSLIEHQPHWSLAGLQFADVVASAFYCAANTIGPGKWNTEPAKKLRRIMATEIRIYASFGVSLHPTPAWKGKLTEDQRQIFQYYGYNPEKW